jgi:hypothetical protein
MASEAMIDESDDGPQNYGDLTEIRTIDGSAYTVGMSRTVYRREEGGTWTRLDFGVRTGDDDDSDAGFTSIDGFTDADLYAVGWDGEIWTYNGNDWEKQESGTNLILFRVVCGGDGQVYACGQKGILLRGTNRNWEVIDHGLTKLKFWGATWFRGKLYLATTKALFVLDQGILKPVEIKPAGNFEFAKNMSFYRLDSSNQVMWSTGRKMILITEDGENWYEPPYMS